MKYTKDSIYHAGYNTIQYMLNFCLVELPFLSLFSCIVSGVLRFSENYIWNHLSPPFELTMISNASLVDYYEAIAYKLQEKGKPFFSFTFKG